VRERALIDRYFKPVTGSPAARGLADDAAVLMPPAGRELVITKDMIAQNVHFLPDDPPETVAHKLLAVNLSDLAAMGATPLACLLGLGLARDTSERWVAAFATGLGAACNRFTCPLIGGDTIAGLDRPVLSLTAFGHIGPGQALARSGAHPGDDVWVSGTIGEAGLGLALLRQDSAGDPALIARYRTPTPRLALGQALVGLASAAADVSDGLLADVRNIAIASGLQLVVNRDDVPVHSLSAADPSAAMTAGDDYELVFTAPAGFRPRLVTLSQTLGVKLSRIGRCAPGSGVVLVDATGAPQPILRFGFEHESGNGRQESAKAGSEEGG
jgi:thiamine-monophosphate kinase